MATFCSLLGRPLHRASVLLVAAAVVPLARPPAEEPSVPALLDHGDLAVTEELLPLHSYQLYDFGAADLNQDGWTDFFTTNCYARPSLLLGNGKGSFVDALHRLGLQHDPQLPGYEVEGEGPSFDGAGMAIFWRYTSLAHDARPSLFVNWSNQVSGSMGGSLTLTSPVRCFGSSSVQAEVSEQHLEGGLVRSQVRFSGRAGDQLIIASKFVSVPLRLELDPEVVLKQVYLGSLGQQPTTHSMTMTLTDRHGMAFADFDGDGDRDVFVVRGGLRGQMRLFPEDFADELFCCGEEQFHNHIAEQAIDKRDQRGRQVAWVDVNQDGWLDLFVLNKQGPTLLYLGDGQGGLVPGKQSPGPIGDGDGVMAWLDVNGDGALDLFLAETHAAAWFENRVAAVNRERQEQGLDSDLAEESAGWFLRHRLDSYPTGKIHNLSLADFDTDGDLDVFVAREAGNFLYENHAAGLRRRDPAERGLPASSLAAEWCDVDNDGVLELFSVPQGLFHRDSAGRFSTAGELAVAGGRRFEDARCRWVDVDNNGSQDLAVCLKPTGKKLWRTRLLRLAPGNSNWVQFDLVGPRGNREAVGAQVRVSFGTRQAYSEVGFSGAVRRSQGHYRLHWGAGNHEDPVEVEVRWPLGSLQRFQGLVVRQRHVLRYKD